MQGNEVEGNGCSQGAYENFVGWLTWNDANGFAFGDKFWRTIHSCRSSLLSKGLEKGSVWFSPGEF